MKTKTIALFLALLAGSSLLFAQQPAPAQAQPEPRGNEANRRPSAGTTPAPREARAGAAGERFNPPAAAWMSSNQPMPQPRPDPFTESFFPPDLIMRHQHALNLTEDQRKRMIDTIQKSQPQFTEVQWQLEAEQTALTALMRAEHPDEKQIVAQLDKVLALEGAMKRGQLTMLVRLKNELTPEQQQKLREMMHRPMPGPGPAMPQRAPGAPR